MSIVQTRRRFLTLSMAGAAGFAHIPLALPAEGPLETTAVRIVKSPAICIAPQYIAEELLQAEGFTDIRYVEMGSTDDYWDAMAAGKVDFSLTMLLRTLRPSMPARRSRFWRA